MLMRFSIFLRLARYTSRPSGAVLDPADRKLRFGEAKYLRARLVPGIPCERGPRFPLRVT